MKPPEPKFNVNDNDECRGIINDYYRDAKRGWEGDQKFEQDMSKYIKDLLSL